MVSRYDTFLTNSGPIGTNRHIRPTRVAILHGSRMAGNNLSDDEIHSSLIQLFLPLNVRIFSVLEMTQAGISDLVSSQEYDVIGLIGEADEFDFVRRKSPSSAQRLKLRSPSEEDVQKDGESIVLAFAPKEFFKDSKKYLKIADAIVLCDVSVRNWQLEVSQVVYHFFESLVVPSMLNIDLADVKHIAKGIGLAFNLSEDSSKKIISRLPKACLVARSALLHFSCDDDVRLKEVYAVSKTVALKKGVANFDPQISTHADAKRIIRKVNVKMGIRIRELNRKENVAPQLATVSTGNKRISLTAILFGL